MGRRHSYWDWGWDRYKPPDFQPGDWVHFRGGRNLKIDGVLVWEIVEVGVIYRYSHGWVRVRSSRSGLTRHALPTRLRMVESAGERVAKVLMGDEA